MVYLVPFLAGSLSALASPFLFYALVKKQVVKLMAEKGIVDQDWRRHIWIQPSVPIGVALLLLFCLTSGIPLSLHFYYKAVMPEVAFGETLGRVGGIAFVVSYLLFLGYGVAFALYRKYKK